MPPPQQHDEGMYCCETLNVLVRKQPYAGHRDGPAAGVTPGGKGRRTGTMKTDSETPPRRRRRWSHPCAASKLLQLLRKPLLEELPPIRFKSLVAS